MNLDLLQNEVIQKLENKHTMENEQEEWDLDPKRQNYIYLNQEFYI